MSTLVDNFSEYRKRMNDVILSKNDIVMKCLWNLDTNAYEEGVLSKKTKAMLRLVARFYGVMIVSNIIWVNLLSLVFQLKRCMKFLQFHVSLTERL